MQCVHIGGYIEKAVLVYMCTATAAACVHRIGRTDRVVESDFLMDFLMGFPMGFPMEEKQILGFLPSPNPFCCEAPSKKIFDNGEVQSESTAANGAARSENTSTGGREAQPITGKVQNKIYPKKRNSCRPTRAERRFRQQKEGKTPIYAQ